MIYRPARRLSDLAPEEVRLVVRLAGVLRPRPASYSEITEGVLRFTDGLWVRPPLVRRVLARHAPELLERRAVARKAARPRPRPLDLRRDALEARMRALIVAKARILIEAPGGSMRPAYTLAELGRLAPRPLGLWQVRRLILAEPGGAELLRARFEARRGKLHGNAAG